MLADETIISDIADIKNKEDRISILKNNIAIAQGKLSGPKQLIQKKKISETISKISEWSRELNILTSGVEIEDDDYMDVFTLIALNTKQVAIGESNSYIITGNAGVGKTQTVLDSVDFLIPKIDKSITNAIAVDVDDYIETDINDEIETEPVVRTKPISFFNSTSTISVLEDDVTIPNKTIKLKIPSIEDKTEIVYPIINSDDPPYIYVKGTCTAAALYELLWLYRTKLIIADDIDKILKDDDAMNYIKAAVDTYAVREISKLSKNNTFNSMGMTDEQMWERYEEHDGKLLPNKFKFTGKLIVISNIHEDDFDEAFLSRSIHTDVRLSREELIDRMHFLMPRLRENVCLEYKMEALKYLEFIAYNYPCKFKLDIRSFIHAINFKASNPITEYTLKNGKKELEWKLLLKKHMVKQEIKY